MAHFVLICRDKANAIDTRLATRPAHGAYVAERMHIVRVAGPLLDDEGTMIGSLFIMECDSKDEVQAFADNDPYTAAGVFESVEIKGFTVARGAVG
jgi:uncharacterized protein YciI